MLDGSPEITVTPDLTIDAGGERCAVTPVGDDEDAARARCAAQCADGPLTIVDRRPGWVVFAAGDARVATYVTTPKGGTTPVVFAVRGK